jgi:hypothetical protein
LKQFQYWRQELPFATLAAEIDRRVKADKKRKLPKKKTTSGEKENYFSASARRRRFFSYSFAAFNSLPTHA